MSKSQFQKEYEEYQKYKEWQEVICCKNAQEVIDFVMSNYLTEDEKCKTIAEQSQRIAELEEQLKNAIVPKFKGEDVAFRVNIFTKDIERVVIVSTKIEIICNINISYTIACLGENQTLANIDIRNIIEDFGTYISQEREEDLFTTKEEAQAKLKELGGNNG